jgi:hypothetical protein
VDCPAWCRASHQYDKTTIRHFGDHTGLDTVDENGDRRALAVYLHRADGHSAGVEFLLFADKAMVVGMISLADAEKLATRLAELVAEARTAHRPMTEVTA